MVLSRSAGVTCWALGGLSGCPCGAERSGNTLKAYAAMLGSHSVWKASKLCTKSRRCNEPVWSRCSEMPRKRAWRESRSVRNAEELKGFFLMDFPSTVWCWVLLIWLALHNTHTDKQTAVASVKSGLYFFFFFFNGIYLAGMRARVSVYTCKSEVSKNFYFHKWLEDRFVGVV